VAKLATAGRHAVEDLCGRLAAARDEGLVSSAEGGNFGFTVGERKFWMGDLVTLRHPMLRMGLVFRFGLLEIV